MRQHESILEYRRGRYFKLAVALCALACGAYLVQTLAPSGPRPYGGTWLGYTLGCVAAALVLWLLALGVRRRAYHSRLGTVQGWTSAHVYLGVAVIVIATLHTGFEFGWNVHTLAYVLLLLTVASGAWGTIAYLRLPERITRNLAGEPLEALLLRVADLDRQCRRLALDLPDEVATRIARATRSTLRELSAGRSLRQQLRAERVRCPTRAACDELRRIGAHLGGEDAVRLDRLLRGLMQKSVLLERVRRHMRMTALLQVWQFVHVPLAFALLGALIAHVLAVFYFW